MAMYEYKDANYYNDYCNALADFTLVEAFRTDDKGENYVGVIMPNKCLHRVKLEVKIPKTFPHNRMAFYTRSLSGYPHLIPCRNRQGWSWFCLNSAFAETPERQLDEEFGRLREWMSNQLRPELPAHIQNATGRRALSAFDIYGNENYDELTANAAPRGLIFMGDFGQSVSNFYKTGCLHTIANLVDNSSRQGYIFIAFKHREGTNHELPYVLVDHVPANPYSLSSWVNEFGWNKEVVDSLLPDFKMGEDYTSSMIDPCLKNDKAQVGIIMRCFDLPDEEEAREDHTFLEQCFKNIDMPNETHKRELRRKIDEYEEDRAWDRNFNGYKEFETEEELLDRNDTYFDMDCYEHGLHYFAIGVTVNDRHIDWYLVSANRANLKKEQKESATYFLGEYTRKPRIGKQGKPLSFKFRFEAYRNIDVNLCSIEMAGKTITEESYFGRGSLSPALSSKKVAIIGLGAIGSVVAQSLTRSGLKEISLWDGDYIEPGNICRSAYDISNIGEQKAWALEKELTKISPYCKITAYASDFYGAINYESQAKYMEELKKHDLIIDCTASNGLLHFLSFAARETPLVSLCITNHSHDLLCLSNQDGDVYELRKHYLGSIEQETGNYYSEGTGCYTPTFLATYCDIDALTQMFVRTLNRDVQCNGVMHSTLWHYEGDNIVAERLRRYKLEGGGVTLIISDKIEQKIASLPALRNGDIGYLIGGYSQKGDAIYVTGAISKVDCQQKFTHIYKASQRIIDYVGNICLATDDKLYKDKRVREEITAYAGDTQVNTNDPLIAYVSPSGEIGFELYIDKEFVRFIPIP